MLTIQYAKDPFWNDDSGNSICLTVKFLEFNEELPFTATNYDSMAYGVELYTRAKAGEFGVINPYVPPPEPVQPVIEGAQTL